MNQLEAMQIFARVAELTSFTRAAESLGIPKASASTAVQQLESMLGARLLHRTTRRVELTQDGQAFYERSKDLLADMDDLQSMFQQGTQAVRGRIRVDMPGAIARRFIVPALPVFLDEHPQLQVELSSTDRRVDLVREGFDCVLRIGDLGDVSLVARTLGHLLMVNCASPDYLRRYGMPKNLADLSNHRMVHYVPTLGGKADGWEYPDGAGYSTVPMAGSVTVNNVEAFEAACLAGLGMVQAPLIGMQQHFDEGLLSEVLPRYRAEPMPVSLLYANRRNLSKRVQLFMNWMADILTPHLLTAGNTL